MAAALEGTIDGLTPFAGRGWLGLGWLLAVEPAAEANATTLALAANVAGPSCCIFAAVVA